MEIARGVGLDIFRLDVHQGDALMPQRDHGVAIVVGDVGQQVSRAGDLQAVYVLRDVDGVAVVEIDHHVLATTAAEHEGVVAGAPNDGVVALTGIDDVVAVTARYELLPGAGMDYIVAARRPAARHARCRHISWRCRASGRPRCGCH